MPTTAEISTQFSSFPAPTTPNTTQRVPRAMKRRPSARFAAIAGLSFALTLPVLGIIDPQVLLSSGLSDAHAVEVLVSRAESALRNMAVAELFATGGAALLVLAGMVGAGYLRVRHKEARLTAEH